MRFNLSIKDATLPPMPLMVLITARFKAFLTEITDSLKMQLQHAFKTIYNNTFDGALIRCDFFVIDDKVYLNEINPIPGSMANYLFTDFEAVLIQLMQSLPKKRNIAINYQYINKIKTAKGK